MKFLVDAQLPPRLARELIKATHDVRHTLELGTGNGTPDDEICRIADTESRIVVTKDRDFVTTYWLKSTPKRLLLISTGNISNDALLVLLASTLPKLEQAFADHTFVELTANTIVIHA